MQDLEYRIGKLEIEPSISAKHLVENNNKVLSIYVAPANKHRDIVSNSNLNEGNIIGGGYIIIANNKLKIYGYSIDYLAIPNKVAKQFGDIILKELAQRGLNLDEVETTIDELFVDNSLWGKLLD